MNNPSSDTPKRRTSDSPGPNSPLDNCIRPLLKHLEWKGDERTLFESLPHLMMIQTLERFCWVMQSLGYTNKKITVNLQYIDERLFPCLFVPKDGSAPKVIIEKVGQDLSVYDGEKDKRDVLRDLDIDGVIVSFKPQGAFQAKQDSTHWFRNVLVKEKNLFLFVGFLTFIQTILMIATPTYIIFIYDKVIAAKSGHMLFTFFAGILFALLSLIIVMNLRSRMLGHIGSRMQKNIGNMIFLRLLKLPPIYVETASVTAQIIRLNDFNQVREFFGGPLFSALIELPFTVIFFVFIWIVGGILTIVPVVSVIVTFLTGYLIMYFSKRIVRDSSITRAKYQDFLLEALWGMRSLQFSGLQKKWVDRYNELSATACLQGKGILLLNGANEAIFDALNLLTGLAALLLGAVLAMENTINLGALIGTMFVIWRIMAPVKMLAMTLPKLFQLKLSIKQINDLMRLPTELPIERQWQNTPRHILGALSFSQVTFRYPGADAPALKNVAFSVKPGECLVIVGPSAAGKSTLANLLLAIYEVQSGHVFVDGRNIKQYDVSLLRKNIAYVPQKSELFYGTIEQNLKLAQPLASKEQIIEAAKMANLLSDIEAFPLGFETRIRFYGDDKLGPSFCQKINLARAFLRDSPILIMDEPTASLDSESAQQFKQYVQSVKGHKTVLIFGHSASLLEMADTGIVLYDGYIVTSGTPDEVLKNIPKGMV